jgi:hypothetical protein
MRRAAGFYRVACPALPRGAGALCGFLREIGVAGGVGAMLYFNKDLYHE